MPAALANLYCLPGDLYDTYSVEGAQLRVDDASQATGQTITTTAAAAAAATSLSVIALSQPLLAGDNLVFSGGDSADFVTVVLSAVALAGSTTLSVASLSAAIAAGATAIDSGVNVATARRLVQACIYGTSRVKDYCCGRYDDSELVLSNSATRWATALACRWLGRRRGNLAPKSIEEEAKEALDELKQVQSGNFYISDIGTRTSAWPFFSNVTIDLGYTIRKVRVEPSISEGTPTLYPQAIDWSSALLFEW